MSKEQLHTSPEHQQDPEALREAAEAARERLHDDVERRAEASPEANLESARYEALEKAATHEQEHQTEHEAAAKNPERPRHTVTKTDRQASYDRTMNDIQTHMSPASRTFSKVIHQPTVEKVSAAVGATVARPNAILSGAVCAFLLTLTAYLIGRYLGYPLSGFETIGAFVLGWVLGLLYDFLRVMITGKKA